MSELAWGELLGALAALAQTPGRPEMGLEEESELLASSGLLYGLPIRCLIAMDREGMAHCIAGTLPEGPHGPRMLDALEASSLWSQAGEGEIHGSDQLCQWSPGWPALPGISARLFREGSLPLGAVLFDGAPAHTDEARREAAQAADRLLRMACRTWLLERTGSGLFGLVDGLIGALDEGVLIVDGQGRITFLSARGSEILGIDPEQAKGADCTRVIRPAVGERHPLLAGLDGEVERIEIYVTDGRSRDLPLALQMRRMQHPGGALGLVCLFRDLTEERSFDLDAQRRERLAAIGELAAGVAHEIRNPLTGIGNCAQVLQMRLSAPEGEGLRRMADLILKETQRLDRIVTNLLGFARPGPPRMVETHIDEAVRSALELQQPICEKHGVRCELRVSGRIPAIYVDPEQIQQVLVNLMRNAVQAMQDGGVLTLEVLVIRRRTHRRRGMGRRATDRVRIPQEAPLARFVRVRVRDTGIGIAPDVLPRIFDPFFTTRSEGTGLGLSVSQSVVQEHGGFLSVQSVHGKGTAFDVDLPVERRSRERRKEPRG
ncbi:MAG: ATP-binding protein [Candidatus Eisenbacteria bacterium]